MVPLILRIASMFKASLAKLSTSVEANTAAVTALVQTLALHQKDEQYALEKFVGAAEANGKKIDELIDQHQDRGNLCAINAENRSLLCRAAKKTLGASPGG